jgi:hypothetical protein
MIELSLQKMPDSSAKIGGMNPLLLVELAQFRVNPAVSGTNSPETKSLGDEHTH